MNDSFLSLLFFFLLTNNGKNQTNPCSNEKQTKNHIPKQNKTKTTFASNFFSLQFSFSKQSEWNNSNSNWIDDFIDTTVRRKEMK